jgi:hypothetical protein
MLYLLHFDQPYRHARHYLGFTKRAGLADRILEHASGGAACSPLVKAAMRAGCIISIARVWPDGSQTLERKLKNRGGLARQCPICKEEARCSATTTETTSATLSPATVLGSPPAC